MEHVAFTLLPLAEAEHQVAANFAPTTPGGAASDYATAAMTAMRSSLSAAFQAFNHAVERLLKDFKRQSALQASSNPCIGILEEVRQRLLGGPCLQTYIAAGLTEALHRLDGSGRAGLPPCWPYLLPKGDGERNGSGRARRLTDADKESVTRTACVFTQALAEGQLLTDETQPAPPNNSAQQASTASASNDTSLSGHRLPMSKARIFRLALRVLRWATGMGASQDDAPAAQQQEAAATAAASTSAATPTQALPRAWQPMRDDPFSLGEYAAAAAANALSDWRYKGSTQCAQRVHARACDMLPPIIALIHSAVSYSTTAASSSGRVSGVPDQAVGRCLKMGLSALCCICELLSSDLSAQGVAAAVRAEMLPALQACVAWLTPERACCTRGRWDPKLASVLLDRVVRCSDSAMVLAPEQQAASLMVTTRSSFAAAVAALDKEPQQPALHDLVDGLQQLLDQLMFQLLEYAPEAPQPWHGGRTAVFALQQWAVVVGPYLASKRHAAMRTPGPEFVSPPMWWRTAFAALCVLVRAKYTVEDPAAAAPTRAAALRAAASWRALLLRDMRVLDALACDLRTMSRCSGQESAAFMMLCALEFAAYALPEEVRQHMEAGRAAACGRAPPPSAAGRGPIWLAVDDPVRDLLSPRRCNRLPLLAYLEGRSGGAVAFKKHMDAHQAIDKGLLPPCDAQLIETCSYPGCGNGAYATAAASPAAAAPLSMCAKCKCVRYCSRACQAAHWREWHKAECGKGWWAVP